MASTSKPSSLVDRVGRRVREEAGVVEIDAAFGRMLGFADGQKVRMSWQSGGKQTKVAKVALQVVILLHLDPPLAHTVHIEPLTPADWESERVSEIL